MGIGTRHDTYGVGNADACRSEHLDCGSMVYCFVFSSVLLHASNIIRHRALGHKLRVSEAAGVAS